MPFASTVALLTMFGPVTFVANPRATPKPKLFLRVSEILPAGAGPAFGAACAVSVTDVDDDSAPEVPAMTTAIEFGVVSEGTIVRVEFTAAPFGVTLLGVNVQVAPVGQTAVKSTA